MSEFNIAPLDNKNNIDAASTQKISKKIYTAVDKAYAFIFCAVGYFFVKLVMDNGISTNHGINIFIFTIIYITAVLSYAHFKHIKPSKESYFWLVVILCISVPFMFFSFLNVFQIFGLIVIAAYWTVSVGGCLVKNESSEWIALDGLHSIVSLPFGNFGGIFYAAFTDTKKDKITAKNKLKIAGGIILGLVLAIISLSVILPVLYSADKNFLMLFKNFQFNFKFNFSNFLVYFIPSALVSLYLFGLASNVFNSTKPAFLQDNGFENERNKCRFATSYTLKIFIYIICAVYALFIFLQASYLFSAFKGTLYGEMTYAQYAKNGFFELCRVCLVNIAVLAVCNFFNTDKQNKNIKLPVIVLSAISLVLLSTAAAKLIMYITAYGLTPKRIAGIVALFWLSLVFVLIIMRFFKSFKLAKISIISAAVAFCLLCVFNINSISKNYNLHRSFEENTSNYYQALDDLNF